MEPIAPHTPTVPALSRALRAGHDALATEIEALDDVQIAAQLDNAPIDEMEAIFNALPPERRAAVLEAMRYEAAGELVRRLPHETAAGVLDDLDSEDATDILQRLEPAAITQILARFDPDEVDEVEELLGYDPNSAAGIMSPVPVRFGPDLTVGAAISAIQSEHHLPEETFYVYVVDDDEHLLGVVALRSLVIHAPATALREIMRTDVQCVRADMDQEAVADLAGRYDLVSIPVVDGERRLLGIVTIDDIVDVLREEATEDILKMAGAGEDITDTHSFGASFRARLPWLGLTAIGGLVVATSLATFADALAVVPALALFMPVVAGMGGNVGTQSATVLVRGLAVGYLAGASPARVILREVALGVSLGLLCGLLVAAVAPLIAGGGADPWRLGAVVCLGLTGSTTIAATVGTCVPLVLDRFGIDPAVATGPFVTTSVDMLGLLCYFALASLLLGIA